MKLYRVIKDEKGGAFGMGRILSAEEWLEQALGWLDADSTDYTILDTKRAYYQGEIAKGNEQELIDYIAETWQLGFEVVSEGLQKAYKDYVAQFDPKYGDPVCFSEWLDYEGENAEWGYDRHGRCLGVVCFGDNRRLESLIDYLGYSTNPNTEYDNYFDMGAVWEEAKEHMKAHYTHKARVCVKGANYIEVHGNKPQKA